MDCQIPPISRGQSCEKCSNSAACISHLTLIRCTRPCMRVNCSVILRYGWVRMWMGCTWKEVCWLLKRCDEPQCSLKHAWRSNEKAWWISRSWPFIYVQRRLHLRNGAGSRMLKSIYGQLVLDGDRWFQERLGTLWLQLDVFYKTSPSGHWSSDSYIAKPNLQLCVRIFCNSSDTDVAGLYRYDTLRTLGTNKTLLNPCNFNTGNIDGEEI